MNKIDLKSLTISKALDDMAKNVYSAEDLTRAYLENIKIRNAELNAYLRVFDDAIDEARKVDEKRKKGEKLGKLAGIPIAIKDVIMVKEREITGGSKILKGHMATYDATCVARLRAEDAIFLGITNTDEFAMGSSTENSAYGPSKNPLDITRVPGGSSGGSASALAADICLVALGTETGGSVRQPAAFCGLVGMKPSYGAVSRYGLLALCSSFDQVGVFSKTVEDSQIIFDIIAGVDPMDSTSIDYSSKLKTQNAKPKLETIIGIPELDMKGVDERVVANFNDQVKKAEDLGFKIKKISLPNIKYSIPTYYIILPAEASSNLARYDGIRYGTRVEGDNLLAEYTQSKGQGFGKEPRRRIILGTYVLSAGYYDAYYGTAMRVRELIKQDFDKAFEEVDAILMPTTPGPAFKLGTKSTRAPLEMYLEDIFTAPANIAGICGISVPSGTVSEDNVQLPLGLQIIADKGREDLMYDIAKSFEQ